MANTTTDYFLYAWMAVTKVVEVTSLPYTVYTTFPIVMCAYLRHTSGYTKLSLENVCLLIKLGIYIHLLAVRLLPGVICMSLEEVGPICPQTGR